MYSFEFGLGALSALGVGMIVGSTYGSTPLLFGRGGLLPGLCKNSPRMTDAAIDPRGVVIDNQTEV